MPTSPAETRRTSRTLPMSSTWTSTGRSTIPPTATSSSTEIWTWRSALPGSTRTTWDSTRHGTRTRKFPCRSPLQRRCAPASPLRSLRTRTLRRRPCSPGTSPSPLKMRRRTSPSRFWTIPSAMQKAPLSRRPSARRTSAPRCRASTSPASASPTTASPQSSRMRRTRTSLSERLSRPLRISSGTASTKRPSLPASTSMSSTTGRRTSGASRRALPSAWTSWTTGSTPMTTPSCRSMTGSTLRS